MFGTRLWIVICFILGLVLLSFFVPVDRKKKIVVFGNALQNAAEGPGGYISLLASLLHETGLNRYQLLAHFHTGKFSAMTQAVSDYFSENYPFIIIALLKREDVEEEKSPVDKEHALEDAYGSLVAKLVDTGGKVILCTIPYDDKVGYGYQRRSETPPQQAMFIRKIAKDLHLPLVDLADVLENLRNGTNTARYQAERQEGAVVDHRSENRIIAELLFTAIKSYE